MRLLRGGFTEVGAPVLAGKGCGSADNRCRLGGTGYCDLIMYLATRDHLKKAALPAGGR